MKKLILICCLAVGTSSCLSKSKGKKGSLGNNSYTSNPTSSQTVSKFGNHLGRSGCDTIKCLGEHEKKIQYLILQYD